jgi:hypothetical protein
MPLYVYRILRPGVPVDRAQTFELRQSIHDPPLKRHPKTGEPVERVICPPTISRGALSDTDIAAAGFTKYKRTSDGTYERQAGSGPKHVDPHSPRA